MRNTLNYHCLEALDACREQVALFRRVFGDGDIFVTRRDMLKARAAGLNTAWLRYTLSDTMRAEYERVRDAAYVEYARVCEAAYAEPVRVCDAAYAEYARVRDAALAEYARVRDAAYTEYERVRDAALADAWRRDVA